MKSLLVFILVVLSLSAYGWEEEFLPKLKVLDYDVANEAAQQIFIHHKNKRISPEMAEVLVSLSQRRGWRPTQQSYATQLLFARSSSDFEVLNNAFIKLMKEAKKDKDPNVLENFKQTYNEIIVSKQPGLTADLSTADGRRKFAKLVVSETVAPTNGAGSVGYTMTPVKQKNIPEEIKNLLPPKHQLSLQVSEIKIGNDIFYSAQYTDNKTGLINEVRLIDKVGSRYVVHSASGGQQYDGSQFIDWQENSKPRSTVKPSNVKMSDVCPKLFGRL